MSKVLVTDTYLTNIGNAIRGKNGATTKYKPSEMPAAITALSPAPTGEIEITENGSVDVTEYATANVNVPQPSGSITITENGTVNVKNYVTAVVNVAGSVSDDITIYLSQYNSTTKKMPISVPKNKTWAEICTTINDFYIKNTNKIWSYLGAAQVYHDADGDTAVLSTETPVEGTQYFCN